MITVDPDKINLHPYAAAVFYHLAGKEIDINSGDQKTTMNYFDFNLSPKNIIRGVLEDVIGDCLIIRVGDARAFVNVWAIRAIVPSEGQVPIHNIYIDDDPGGAKRDK